MVCISIEPHTGEGVEDTTLRILKQMIKTNLLQRGGMPGGHSQSGGMFTPQTVVRWNPNNSTLRSGKKVPRDYTTKTIVYKLVCWAVLLFVIALIIFIVFNVWYDAREYKKQAGDPGKIDLGHLPSLGEQGGGGRELPQPVIQQIEQLKKFLQANFTDKQIQSIVQQLSETFCDKSSIDVTKFVTLVRKMAREYPDISLPPMPIIDKLMPVAETKLSRTITRKSPPRLLNKPKSKSATRKN
jgi:hypothetical protein